MTLAGCIDERADLSPIRSVSAGTLVLDLAGVTRINSVGVREWIKAMKGFPSTVSVTWVNVAECLVAQLSMIANFSGPARIATFFAPYFCDDCGHEERHLMTVAEVSTSATAPAQSCGICGAQMAFDDIEEDYLGAIIHVTAAA